MKNSMNIVSATATMSKPLDSTQYPSLSKMQDMIKPIDTSVLFQLFVL